MERVRRREGEHSIYTTVWDKKFEVRREKTGYQSECDCFIQNLSLAPDGQVIIALFLEGRDHYADPGNSTFSALRQFLLKEPLSRLSEHQIPLSQELCPVSVNDRREAMNGANATRNWEAYKEQPPKGENRVVELYEASGLYRMIGRDVGFPMTPNPVLTNCQSTREGQLAQSDG